MNVERRTAIIDKRADAILFRLSALRDDGGDDGVHVHVHAHVRAHGHARAHGHGHGPLHRRDDDALLPQSHPTDALSRESMPPTLPHVRNETSLC